MIHCFGNSHINTFSNCDNMSYISNNDTFKLYHLGPTIAYNFFEHHYPNVVSMLHNINVKTDYVTLVVGEVDCRLHLPKQADIQKISDKVIVDECVNRLFKCYSHLQELGVKCLVYSTHPTTSYICPDNKDYIYDTMKRRNDICVLWNDKCKSLCLERNMPFISFYNKLVNDNNETNMDHFLDYCHLKSSMIYPTILVETMKVIYD